MIIYRNTIDGTEHVALTRGRIEGDRPTLVRMHRVDMAADMLGHTETRRDYVPEALRRLGGHDGAGVAVFLRDPNPSWLSERYGGIPAEDNMNNALRDYGVGAQILLDLGVREMVLMSTRPVKPAALDGYGLKIVGWRQMGSED